MENKEIATVGKITGELIGGFFLYGILFAILYNIVYSFIVLSLSSASKLLIASIAIILQGLAVFCIWRCSISTTFKKRAIDRNDVSTVIRNLLIFTVIVCIINGFFNFYDAHKKFDKAISSNTSLTMLDQFADSLYSTDQKAQYQAEKEKALNEAKSELTTYIIILEVGLLIVYLGVVPLQKKSILKHAV